MMAKKIVVGIRMSIVVAADVVFAENGQVN